MVFGTLMILAIDGTTVGARRRTRTVENTNDCGGDIANPSPGAIERANNASALTRSEYNRLKRNRDEDYHYHMMDRNSSSIKSSFGSSSTS